MQIAFVLNRPMRKTLRITTPKKQIDNTKHTDLTSCFHTELRTDAYHNQNLCEFDYDHDEFGDIDNEYDGLTITEPMSEAELWKFCTGYDVL